MAMAGAEERFPGAGSLEPGAHGRQRSAEERCLEAEQRCFRAERRRFEAERQREQLERLLAEARRAGLRMQQIVAELKRLAAELRHAGGALGPRSAGEPSMQAPPPSGDRMVDALSAAIARLRASVEAVGEAPAERRDTASKGFAHVPVHAWAPPAPPAPAHPPHKHSMSWIARWRIKRKQRASR